MDTSNEIGGDGDVPHSGIGNARRMQVIDRSVGMNVFVNSAAVDDQPRELECNLRYTLGQKSLGHAIWAIILLKRPKPVI